MNAPSLLPLGSTLQVLRPHPNILAFYDGRIPGARAHSAAPNWLDDGAYALGVCVYAVIAGEEAILYDTHISIPHARLVRRTLEEAGVKTIRVVLSHWHDDHVAGNEVFADCEILALDLTGQALAIHRLALENGDPPIYPLVLPSRTITGPAELFVGDIRVELLPAEIHSHDGLILALPDLGILLAGDTLEEPITYVAEPERLAVHVEELKRVKGWNYARILPNHGAAEIIAAGGYGPGLIEATIRYVEKLMRLKDEPALADEDLRTFAGADFASGTLTYFAPYEEVHANNVKKVLALP
ncbi:MBL fold metallo-hydrolase [Ancylobacter amanitiformis]|uniref:Glyoxylase-like metal-dependent hydrolase (Beta-lactamase superfamily II) n=1 Tax=Ancylobacter amanitiformis TaxID=217069 RepID=A0ABU0LNI8_9HYPH|nr:MBL fold metallo-hydrolase [Ancylobacter amanitiformis]MDQ0510228.1 glyoxylase-like metal-dependent hydrolase (beta-lactamase superfamily II) [Ancylobacter amanitiformis]